MSLNEVEHATQLLLRWQSRDKNASKELIEHAYQDVRSIISRLIQSRRPTETLLQDSSVTELANESIVKLYKWRNDETPIENRREFFEYVRISVWHLLFGKPHHQVALENENKQAALREFQQLLPQALNYQFESNHDLYCALEELRQHYPRQFQVFEFKHFAFVANYQIADLLDISPRTVDNDVRFAAAWLKKRLSS
ncbi:hypothetical protein K0504_12965 [Neiella marina]|uniref:RNA polymerase sigma-70 ECF-like HTH domain-containing protein n=1 Tax=Neiella holothuriorum TaxID=2870530 RepID=A0ABS7EHZ5_9GAMM|nr:ECF-type sigma factor [Neiella holothuriorum]MBW8191950.1 hypothetical protein [Neiella holothuriorum]